MSDKRSTSRSVHFNAELKELTVNLWMEGKSQYEMERVIREYLYCRSRHRRGRYHETRASAF
jgi:hypothetical protein